MKKNTFIRRITLLNILLLFTAYNLSAQLFVENFEYPINSVLSTTVSSGWTAASSLGTTPIDVTSGLSFAGYAGAGIGGAANIDNNGEDIYKLFAAQTTGVVYASFIIKTQTSNAAGYFFSFTSNAFSSSSYACRIYVNATGNGVGIGQSAPAPTKYEPISPETPTLLVIKYDLLTRASSLFILNSYQSTEPATADTTYTETITANVGGILLRQYNASQRIIVDGIRVGNTWAQTVAQGCTSSNLGFGNATINKTVGDAPFTQTATSLNLSTAITYSSSAPLVAAVNASTGEIILGVAGLATITATQNAGTYNAIDYCATSTSYSINVTNRPTLTVTEVQFPTLTTAIGTPTTETINISGINLTNDIAISLTGTNAELFSISTNNIVQNAGIGPNTVVAITYTPTTSGSHTATLNLSSTGTDNSSQVINGIGTPITNIKNSISDILISVLNGNLVFTSTAGEIVEIYNSIGQKIRSIKAVEGLNTIKMNTKGVLIVRIGNKLSKILL